MTAMLAQLLPQKEASFQAFWYFTLLGIAILVLTVAAAAMAMRAVRPLLRDGQRMIALLITSVSLLAVLLVVAMAATALGGLANNPATGPGG